MFAKEAFFSWGISLEVTPRITTNGLINVSIVPTISDCTGFVTAEVGASSKSEDDVPYSKYPIINMQRLITDFTLASGTTAVIGGLSKTTEESVDTGIPWLRDWPWIGEKLFGSKSRQKVQKEIIVFVTVGMASAKQIPADLGLPKNAVLGRTYTQGIRQEPGDQPGAFGGVSSLDLRPLEVQARDPANTNKTPEKMTLQLPFQKRR
jgi:type II secretory pathway component GspD/PulD (secretin)